MGSLSSVKSAGQFAPAVGVSNVEVRIYCSVAGDVTITGPTLYAGAATAVATLTGSFLVESP